MQHVVIDPPDTFDRLLDKSAQLAATKAKLGECIHGLNLAARGLDQLGGDGSLYRELADDAKALRWAV